MDVSQYISGIQPTLAGLKIDPCIPHEMDGFYPAPCLARGNL